MKYVITLLVVLMSAVVVGKTTKTTQDGNWSNGATWDNGVPVAGDVILINHIVDMDTDIDVSGSGSMTIGVGGRLVDGAGGSAYKLTIENNATFTVDGGYIKIEGELNVKNNTDVYVRGCDTVITGSTVLENNGDFSVDSCAVWIVNGDVEIKNNVDVFVDGFVKVYGEVETSNNAEMTGTGNISTTGSVNQNNGASLFGSGADCPSGPCFYGSGFPLPLSIVSFELSKVDEVDLEVLWKVHDEDEVLYHEVQRSLDGSNWELVEQVSSEGNSGYNEYKIMDSPGTGTFYYRLYSLQFSGRAEISEIRTVSFEDRFGVSNSFKFYPNPARDLLKFSGDFHSVTVMGIDGKFIKETSSNSLDISDLAAGFYSLRVLNSNQTESLHKLIVQ
jgi:hypothetical protein